MTQETSLIEVPVHGRYLTSPSPALPDAGWVVGFHGYAESASVQLGRLRELTASWNLCAVQGLHRFYNRSGEVVASWMTKEDRELAIGDNIRYVDAVVKTLAGAKAPLVYAGYSQGAAMAYRAAFCGRRAPELMVAVGGDLPPELPGDLAPRLFPVLICRGARDEHYSAEQLQIDIRRLEEAGITAEVLEHSGGHEWSADLSAAIAKRIKALNPAV